MYSPRLDFLSPSRQQTQKYGYTTLNQTRPSSYYPTNYYSTNNRPVSTDPISLVLPSNTESVEGGQSQILRTMDIPTYTSPWKTNQQNSYQSPLLPNKTLFQYERPLSYRHQSNQYNYDIPNYSSRNTFYDRQRSMKKQQDSKQQPYSIFLGSPIIQNKDNYKTQPPSNTINEINVQKSKPLDHIRRTVSQYNPQYILPQIKPYVPFNIQKQGIVNNLKRNDSITPKQDYQINSIYLKSSRNFNEMIISPKMSENYQQPKSSRISQYMNSNVSQQNYFDQTYQTPTLTNDAYKHPSSINNIEDYQRYSANQDYNPMQFSNLPQNTIRQSQRYQSSNNTIKQLSEPGLSFSGNKRFQIQQNPQFNSVRQVQSIIPSANQLQNKGSQIRRVVSIKSPSLINPKSEVLQSLEISQPNDFLRLQQFRQTTSNKPSLIDNQNQQMRLNNIQNGEIQQQIIPIGSPTYSFNRVPSQQQQNNQQNILNNSTQQPQSLDSILRQHQHTEINPNLLNLNEISSTVVPVIPTNSFTHRRNTIRSQQKRLFNRPGVSAIRNHSNRSISQIRLCPVSKNILRTRGIRISKLQHSVQNINVPESIAKNWAQMQS